MSKPGSKTDNASIDALFDEADYWQVNLGDETIHAKRMPGKWRAFKWFTSSLWLFFFLGPYLRWGSRQAVLFDIPQRQFHLFGATILPQDFWMLSLVLLFLAILLLIVTVLYGRAWCGFFCFQTVWTDVYTLIEEKLEGSPQQRRKLDQAPMSISKLGIKGSKHILWLLIAVLTGISFVAWFTDAYTLWRDLFALQLPTAAWGSILLFTAGTYTLAGFMREQVCMWLCPYARIQGAMVDVNTILPAYDFNRGEPRGRIQKSAESEHRKMGDCVACNQCVAVCPMGVDIRKGQQEGCITCALCIDACDAVMDKVGRPRGLIRYESLEGLAGKERSPFYRQPRVLVCSLILVAAILGILYGLDTIDAVELKVLHGRQPLYVLQSNGSIQNKYTLKILNKTTSDVTLKISATGPDGLLLVGADKPFTARHSKVTPITLFVRVPRQNLATESEPILFHIETLGQEERFFSDRESVFVGPPR